MVKETEMQNMNTMNGIRMKSHSTGSSDKLIDIKYTSLKDILPNSPTKFAPNFDINGYDIAIRNQLVKQAASAYLQSAAILTNRNQNCLASFWGKLAFKTALCSYWDNYVRNPLEACARPIYHLFTSLFNRIHLVWTTAKFP